MKKHKSHVDRAKEVARKSTMLHQHGCVIVHRNKVISTGHNKQLPGSFSRSIHAEMDALSKLKDTSFVKCAMIVVRLSPCGQFGTKLSRPCRRCTNCLIASKKISTVYYSN